MATVQEALAARQKAQQEAGQNDKEVPQETLQEKMQKAIAAQNEGAKSAGVTTASTESGVAAPGPAGELRGAAARDVTGDVITGAGNLAQGTISPNPVGQVSAARAAEQAVIPQATERPSPAAVAAGTTELTPEQLAQARKILGLPEVKVSKRASEPRTFQHLFAGAGVLMADGRRLVFGGRPGGAGIYVTQKQDEIDFLEDLSHTSGSQVTEPGVTDDATLNDMHQAALDSRANTERDLDPGIKAARDNLGQTIARRS